MNIIKRYTYCLTILAIAILLNSCDNDEPPTLAKRTILVYMVAANSLGAGNYDISDINEMVTASELSSFNGGRLLIYHAPLVSNPSLKEISNGEITTLCEYDQSTLSVEHQRLQQVIDDTKRLAPAIDYGIILWSHANGWRQTGISPNKLRLSSINTKLPLAFGEEQGKHMNTTTLAQVLNDESFSFIYFDCCYMASIEVAYELRHATKHIIASATEIPAEGMPYEQNLPLLFADSAKLKEACLTTFDYYNCQNGPLRSCAISLIDTQHLDELAQITSEIYSKNNSLSEDFKPQKFSPDSKCYFYDFGQYIDALTDSSPNLQREWHNVMNKVILYKASTPYMWNQLKLNYHSGLSTFIFDKPTDCFTDGYNELQWYNDVVNKLILE